MNPPRGMVCNGCGGRWVVDEDSLEEPLCPTCLTPLNLPVILPYERAGQKPRTIARDVAADTTKSLIVVVVLCIILAVGTCLCVASLGSTAGGLLAMLTVMAIGIGWAANMYVRRRSPTSNLTKIARDIYAKPSIPFVAQMGLGFTYVILVLIFCFSLFNSAIGGIIALVANCIPGMFIATRRETRGISVGMLFFVFLVLLVAGICGLV